MTSVDVKFDLERSKRIYKNYFDFERKRQFKKLPTRIIVALGLASVIAGFITKVAFFYWFGAIILFLIWIVFTYYRNQFNTAYTKYIAGLEKNANKSNQDFTFGFDDEGMSYRSEGANLDLKWHMISYFIVNQEEIYLFTQENRLYDIISLTILGKENFDSFMLLLKAKIAAQESVV